MGEAELLFDKTYTCPVCDRQFKAKTVRSGKVRTNGTDFDLRPRHVQVDAIKYEAIMCPHCGYAAMNRYFDAILPVHRKLIREKIGESFQERNEENLPYYTYDVALEHYKLVLLNNMVKGAKSSELAYTCVKIAWLYRGLAENLDPADPEYELTKEHAGKEEKNYQKKAYQGFVKARMEEDYPMAGMDESTCNYLTAALAIEVGEYDMASRFISQIMGSHTASGRIKDKCYDLKTELTKRQKQQETAE
ncbi:MAG: DUF2225 domain-containing protein [Lachnospiraceae bacterium]|nr:DUF2225 domain-containing protein [Lachnospiraceae bacterium]